MRRETLILLFIAGILGICAGCKAVENQVDYQNMTGSIPQGSWLSSLGSGKNQD